jgi:hypothetical protein
MYFRSNISCLVFHVVNSLLSVCNRINFRLVRKCVLISNASVCLSHKDCILWKSVWFLLYLFIVNTGERGLNLLYDIIHNLIKLSEEKDCSEINSRVMKKLYL